MNAVLKHVTLVAALALSTIHSPAESVHSPLRLRIHQRDIKIKQNQNLTTKSTTVSILEIEMVIETTRRTSVASTT